MNKKDTKSKETKNSDQIIVYQNDQIVKSPEFKSDLEIVTQTRGKKPSKLKMLHAQTQTFIQLAQENASVISFGITITYPTDKDYLQSWSSLHQRIIDILSRLYKLPIYGILLSIEIHKEKLLSKEKRRPMHQSRLKGRPHLHICLMLYNDFLCPSISKIENHIRGETNLNFDLQVTQFIPDDSTKGLFNIKNWFLYCLKEAKDPTSQRFLKKFLNLSTSSFLFSGHPDSYQPCEDLAQLFNQCDFNLRHFNDPGQIISDELSLIDKDLFKHLPFVPQTNSDVLKVSFFLNGILKSLNYAIWPGKTYICRLQEGARATWEEYLALSELYTLIIKQFPIKTQELLINSRPFNLYVRDYQKLDFNWLPQVTIAEHLVELRDGIFDLRTGEFKPHFEDTNLGLISCSTFWPQFTFQNLPWPSP